MSTPREALDECVTYARAQAGFFNASQLVGVLTHEVTGEKYFAWMPYDQGVVHPLFEPAFLVLATQECIPFKSLTDQPARC
jgi:hypothetical protein